MHLNLTRKFIISATCQVTVCFHKLSGFRTISEVMSTSRYTKLRALDLLTFHTGGVTIQASCSEHAYRIEMIWK